MKAYLKNEEETLERIRENILSLDPTGYLIGGDSISGIALKYENHLRIRELKDSVRQKYNAYDQAFQNFNLLQFNSVKD